MPQPLGLSSQSAGGTRECPPLRAGWRGCRGEIRRVPPMTGAGVTMVKVYATGDSAWVVRLGLAYVFCAVRGMRAASRGAARAAPREVHHSGDQSGPCSMTCFTWNFWGAWLSSGSRRVDNIHESAVGKGASRSRRCRDRSAPYPESRTAGRLAAMQSREERVLIHPRPVSGHSSHFTRVTISFHVKLRGVSTGCYTCTPARGEAGGASKEQRTWTGRREVGR